MMQADLLCCAAVCCGSAVGARGTRGQPPLLLCAAALVAHTPDLVPLLVPSVGGAPFMCAGSWQRMRSCSMRATSHIHFSAMFLPVLAQLLGMSAL